MFQKDGKKNWKSISLIIIVLAIIILAGPLVIKVLIGFKNRPSIANLLKLPIPVYAYKVSPKDSQSYLGANADTEGDKVINIMVPEVEVTESLKVGKIIERGTKVKKRDTLAILYSLNLNLNKELISKKLREIEDQLKFLSKNFLETQKELLTKKEHVSQEAEVVKNSLPEKREILKRVLELYEKKYVSLLDVDSAKNDIRNLETKLSGLQADLYAINQEMLAGEKDYKERKFTLEQEKSDLERDLKKTSNSLSALTIRSAIDGYVSEKFVSEGAEVLPKSKLLDISLYSPLRILAHLSHVYLTKINVGQEVYFRFSESGKDYKSTISNKYPTVDKKTQTFDVEILYENKDGKILPGTTAYVRFSEVDKKLLLIPKFSVAGLPEAPIVFIVKDQTAIARKVVLGEFYPFGLVEIREGIEEGEIIIKSPLKYVTDKTKVRILAVEK
jgi:RND family efflux transporter MFP subunit